MDETINITALAVNDNPDQLYLMKRMLGSVGYKVLTAGDGREAFDLLLRERVDILISDVRMTVMDGFAAVAEIRRREGAERLGAARLSNICAKLIDLAEGGDAPALLRALDEMDAELEQVTLKLEQWTLTA